MGIILVLAGIFLLSFGLMLICDHAMKWPPEVATYGFGMIAVLTLIFLVTLSGVAISDNITAEADFARYQQKREVLVYQLENGLYDNDNDVGMKDLYNEVLEYNEDIVTGRINSQNKWIKVFFPLDYNRLELIELPQGER